MAEKKFAFESGKISIAFNLSNGLGDCIIAKKVLLAFIELSPNCLVDIFYPTDKHIALAKGLYGDIKNLNLILPFDETYQKNYQKYDVAFWVSGSLAVLFRYVNIQRLQVVAPEFFQTIVKVDEYNTANVHNMGSFIGVAIRNFLMSKILHKNCYEILSCNGALPIRDDKVPLSLAHEYKNKFKKLKLNKYITIYSDIDREITPPKVKTWPMRHLIEYVGRMKKRFPSVEIVQCGGGGY